MSGIQAEVAEWRRTHTWGGFLWFLDEEDVLTGEELLDEVEWLLDGDVHPDLIAQELHRKRETIQKLAWRLGRDRVREAFKRDPLDNLTWRRAAA